MNIPPPVLSRDAVSETLINAIRINMARRWQHLTEKTKLHSLLMSNGEQFNDLHLVATACIIENELNMQFSYLPEDEAQDYTTVGQLVSRTMRELGAREVKRIKAKTGPERHMATILPFPTRNNTITSR